MFDLLVLTASNQGQARAYQAELAARALGERSTPRTLVVADPGGRRVGSGLSTLQVLAEVARLLLAHNPHPVSLAGLFTGRRVCIIHCGGDSRRLPAYAAQGKVFAPLPLDTDAARPAALFDLILDDLARIPLPDQGRVLVATGDVFLDVGRRELGFDRPGVVGVAWPDTPERGSRHGVYIADPAGAITGFVHKPTRHQAHALGAIRADDTVLIDTGVVCLDPHAVEHWLTRAGVTLETDRPRPTVRTGPGLLQTAIETGSPATDLYGDILPALAHRETLHRIDWRGPLPFSVAVIPESPFLHIGTSRELLDTLTGEPPPIPWWRPLPAGGSARIHNSRLDHTPRTLGPRVVIEACHLRHAPTLPGSNILVGVPGALDAPIELPEGWGLVCLPLESGAWAALLFGEADDFKTPLTRAGSFGNRPLQRLLDTSGLTAEDLWPGLPEPEHTLWTARLWTPSDAPGMLAPAAWMLSGARAPAPWRAAPRLSAAQVMAAADHRRLLDTRRTLHPGE